MTDTALEQIHENTFEAACLDQNTIEDLIESLLERAADQTDCEEWRISPTKWRESIALALRGKIEILEDELEETRGGIL